MLNTLYILLNYKNLQNILSNIESVIAEHPKRVTKFLKPIQQTKIIIENPKYRVRNYINKTKC